MCSLASFFFILLNKNEQNIHVCLQLMQIPHKFLGCEDTTYSLVGSFKISPSLPQIDFTTNIQVNLKQKIMHTVSPVFY